MRQSEKQTKIVYTTVIKSSPKKKSKKILNSQDLLKCSFIDLA